MRPAQLKAREMIRMPKAVMDMCTAHAAMREHFAATGLTFTLDGKLVGEIGEALAAEAFGLTLCRRRTPGVDAHTRDGRSVQIKATGKPTAGPAFTPGEGVAEYLLFLRIDFDHGVAEVAYNGPEARIRQLLPDAWTGTKVVPLARVVNAQQAVPNAERLRRRARR